MWDLFDSDDPDQDATAELERTAAADYPVLEEILHVRPPLPHSTRVASKQGGFLNDLINPGNPDLQRRMENSPSYSWCRFRSPYNSHCMYPKAPDPEGTKQAGYEVWFLEDRGFCPRLAWKLQEECKISEPGPNSGVPESLIECVKNWADGGQRGGIPGPYRDIPSTYGAS